MKKFFSSIYFSQIDVHVDAAAADARVGELVKAVKDREALGYAYEDAGASFELMDLPPEPDLGTRTLDRARGEIAFSGVSLSYPGAERPALDGLSLHVPAGHTVALVGSSGAGKSTLVHALLGFAAPDAGTLTLDGIPVQELRKADLRRQFAVVSQDIVLFDASIAANVAYAAPLDTARVAQCLRAELRPAGVRIVRKDAVSLSVGVTVRLTLAAIILPSKRSASRIATRPTRGSFTPMPSMLNLSLAT